MSAYGEDSPLTGINRSSFERPWVILIDITGEVVSHGEHLVSEPLILTKVVLDCEILATELHELLASMHACLYCY